MHGHLPTAYLNASARPNVFMNSLVRSTATFQEQDLGRSIGQKLCPSLLCGQTPDTRSSSSTLRANVFLAVTFRLSFPHTTGRHSLKVSASACLVGHLLIEDVLFRSGPRLEAANTAPPHKCIAQCESHSIGVCGTAPSHKCVRREGREEPCNKMTNN